jgi:Lactate dehydrogenase and related dehydrogenases
MNIYITAKKNDFNDKQVELLEKIGNIIYIESVFKLDDAVYLNDYGDKILAVDPNYYDWNLTNDHIDKIKNLKALCLSTPSSVWVDIEHCKEQGIVVTNVPRCSTTAVAEYAIFMMMAIARKLPLVLKSNVRSNSSEDYLMSNLKDKKVGVIGLGNIGTNIADLCNGLGMKVNYWSLRTRNDKYKYLELEQLFRESDFIFPAFISSADTKNIITDDLIKEMQENASFVSIIHNSFYNHNLLLEMVKSNKLYGYAFEEENDDIFKYKGNIFVTPSYAGYTKETMDQLVEIWFDSISGIVNNNIINCVN